MKKIVSKVINVISFFILMALSIILFPLVICLLIYESYFSEEAKLRKKYKQLGFIFKKEKKTTLIIKEDIIIKIPNEYSVFISFNKTDFQNILDLEIFCSCDKKNLLSTLSNYQKASRVEVQRKEVISYTLFALQTLLNYLKMKEN